MKKSVEQYTQLQAGAVAYYNVLGADRKASSDVINKAYRKKLGEMRDVIAKDPSKMTQLNVAKEHLLDDAARKAYDMALERYGLPDGTQGGGLCEIFKPVDDS